MTTGVSTKPSRQCISDSLRLESLALWRRASTFYRQGLHSESLVWALPIPLKRWPCRPGPSSSPHPPTTIQSSIWWTTLCEKNYQSHRAFEKWQEIDRIPPELWKEGEPALHSKVHELLVCCSEQGNLSSDLRDAVIVTLQKQGRKVRLLQLSEDHSALHRRKNRCSYAPKQTGTHHHWRPSTRNPVWVQRKHGHYSHGVLPQTVLREIQRADQRIVCSVCEPGQSVWHS